MPTAILIIGALFVVANLAALAVHQRSKRAEEDQNERASIFWGSLYAPLRAASTATRNWIRQAFGAEFGIRQLIIVVLLSLFALLAFIAEYGFLQQVFAWMLGETEETPAMMGLLRVSQMLALFLCASSGIAGILAFDAEKSTALKFFAWNVLAIVCLIEGYLGYTRATEFSVLGGLNAALSGEGVVAAEPVVGFNLVNAAMGFINPLLAAVTARYLITFATWTIASATAIGLFLGLWAPTWLLQLKVVRMNRLSETSAKKKDQPAGPAGEPEPEPDPRVERAAEDEDRLRDYEEAERRRREEAHANPFG